MEQVLTNEMRAQIFAAYWGCTMAQFINAKDGVFGKIASIESDRVYIWMDSMTTSFAHLENCKLILKPISEISDDDAKAIIELMSDYGVLEVDDISLWLDEVMNGNCALSADYVSGNQVQILIDFLRSKGYDCGYSSIPSLIDCGISHYKIKLRYAQDYNSRW